MPSTNTSLHNPDEPPEVGRLLLDHYAHRTSTEPYLSAFTPEFAKLVATVSCT